MMINPKKKRIVWHKKNTKVDRGDERIVNHCAYKRVNHWYQNSNLCVRSERLRKMMLPWAKEKAKCVRLLLGSAKSTVSWSCEVVEEERWTTFEMSYNLKNGSLVCCKL